MIAYKKWDIILVPFPFSDLTTVKKRPATRDLAGPIQQVGDGCRHPFLFTSRTDVSPRPGDYRIRFWKEAGDSPKATLLRMKFATLDQGIIVKRIGRLYREERGSVRDTLHKFFQ